MKKILIIEDNLAVRENTAEILELSNYIVLVAANGKEGIQKAIENLPDLILCDIMMPDLNGYGVLHILNRNPKTAEIPFIFLTAKAEKNDFRKGMGLGADDYITKPFDDADLLSAIELRIQRKKQPKKLTPIPSADTTTDTNIFNTAAKGNIALTALSEQGTERFYAKKKVIYEEDNFPKYLFFIKKGKIKTYKTNELGKEFIISVHETNEFFGYDDLITETEYTESAATLEDTTLLLIPKEEFSETLYTNREFSIQFMKILAANSAEREGKLLSLAYSSIRKRVAEALMELYQRDGGQEIVILREDLANMVGATKESVIRTLTDFKSEALIDIKSAKITVLKPSKLLKLPN